MSLVEKLIHHGLGHCHENVLSDIRIGLGYTVVELNDGAAGVAWTAMENGGGSCTHLKRAGSLGEMTESDALQLLASDAHLERSVGLAVFNAVNSRKERPFSDDDAIDALAIGADDHVVMVGYFAPLIDQIKKTGCSFDVLDLNPAKRGVVDLRSGPALLAACDVAIITATSIINNTVDRLLENLSRARSAVMLGPSTPLCSEAFSGTRITQLSGSLVADAEQVKRIISQAGGTKLMKKHLRFVTLTV